ncbi:MAG: hypothetical protein JWM56_511 [Candidatus Peribacteria bacterium]|nr:hypothetical protein [Candidatus Peribacteria bacterium]
MAVVSKLAHLPASFEDTAGHKFTKRADGVVVVKMPDRSTAEMSANGIRVCNARIDKSLMSVAFDDLAAMVQEGVEGAHEAMQHLQQSIESIGEYLERKTRLAMNIEAAAA